MAKRDDDERQEIYDDFREVVNLAPAELEAWLETDASRSVGSDSGSGESVGHRSGRRIVTLRRKREDELTESDYDHMAKVVGYVRRHLAQRPGGDVEDSRWRRSLRNWGHDPLKEG